MVTTSDQQRQRLLTSIAWSRGCSQRLIKSKDRWKKLYFQHNSLLIATTHAVFTDTFVPWIKCFFVFIISVPTWRTRLPRLRSAVRWLWETLKAASRTWRTPSREPSRTWPARSESTRTWWTSNWPSTLRSPPTENCWRERRTGETTSIAGPKGQNHWVFGSTFSPVLPLQNNPHYLHVLPLTLCRLATGIQSINISKQSSKSSHYLFIFVI